MGKVIKDPCRSCGGSGRTRKEKTLQVNIPAGVEDGTRIRLAGEGEAGMRGAPPGDLYIFLSIAAHRIFQRDGANIFCRVPIPMTTAALGGTIEVPTIDGSKAKVTIPEGTQTGNQFRLRNKGMSVLRSPARGDMFIQAVVETPVALTKRQKELLQEFNEAGEGEKAKNSPESQGFFAKVELWEDSRKADRRQDDGEGALPGVDSTRFAPVATTILRHGQSDAGAFHTSRLQALEDHEDALSIASMRCHCP
jgi:molecular chaperone DnaJ